MNILAIIGIVCLILIVLALQHLANWLFRKAKNDEDVATIFGLLTEGVSFIILYITIIHIIKIF